MALLLTADRNSTVPARPLRSAVPWLTVLPLAVVLAYADGFWMTSLRGAVGAISRTQEPFTSYLRTSTLMLPVFVLAVLAAVTYAFHRFGSELPSRTALVVAGLLVAGFATVAAVALSAASAAYDYYLQSSQLQLMRSMPGMQNDCDAACLGRQQWMTVDAHARAIAYTGAALLVTNIVLVGWVVALRGGRLRLVAPSPRSGPDSATGSRAKDIRMLLVAALLTSAAIHAAVTPEHLQEWPAAGVFFLVLSVAEVAAAAGVFIARHRAAGLALATLVSVIPILLWAASRSAGLPFGPEAGTAEPVGLADCVACLLEIGTLVAVLTLRRRKDRTTRPPLSAHHRALALVAVVALGTLGLGGAASGWLDGIDDLGGAGTTQHHHSSP